MLHFLKIRCIPKKRRQSGVALIEFALSAPILILLLVMLFELGRLYYVYMRFTEINYEGARFFSSLKDPPPACISPQTTNLAYADSSYSDTLSPADFRSYKFHKVIQERVLSLFLYKIDSWPIESSGVVPGTGGTSLKDIPLYYNLPSISTQYVKDNTTQNCPAPTGGAFSPSELDNTVTVCMEADYKGPFFSIPISTCSTGHLLENNESLRIPEDPDGGDDGGPLVSRVPSESRGPTETR